MPQLYSRGAGFTKVKTYGELFELLERDVHFWAGMVLGSACRLEFDLEGLGPLESGPSRQ